MIGLIETGTNLLITFSSRTGSNTDHTDLKTDDRPDRPKRRNKVQFNDKLALVLNYSQSSNCGQPDLIGPKINDKPKWLQTQMISFELATVKDDRL